jgi:hypothetical protein
MSANSEGVASAGWPASTGLATAGAWDRRRWRDSIARFFSWSYLFAPVDTASLAAVRFAIGFLVAYDALRKGARFFYPSAGVLPFSFKYQFFHWVQEAPELSAYLPYVLFVSGIAVAIGFCFRFFSILTLALVSYGFLLKAEDYLNHYYMLILALFLLSLAPANRSFSIDKALFFAKSGAQAPRIYLLLLKAQIEIILIYAGLVKINSDWLQLEPLRTWLLQKQDWVFFGSLWQSDIAVAIGAYGIIILHVVGAPLLLFRRTRLPVFLIYTAFHVTNHFVFEIGIFPWMTIACTTLFFPADWPRRALHRLWPAFGRPSPDAQHFQTAPASFGAQALVAFTACWLLLQVLIPLRHVLYPGWVEWTNEGHRFAWRMKLTDRSTPGMFFALHVPERQVIHVPDLRKYMSKQQYLKVATRPDLVQQLAWQAAALYQKELQVDKIRVMAYVPMTLNNRRSALLIDPTVDLAATRSTIWHDPWITLTNPNPLRRLEEVNADGPETRPTLPQMLVKMGFPEPHYCQRASGSSGKLRDAAVCSLAGSGGTFKW